MYNGLLRVRVRLSSKFLRIVTGWVHEINRQVENISLNNT